MRTAYEERIAEQSSIKRTLAQGDARLCTPNFGRAWKGIYPFKSAENLAALVGCAVRTAAYEISGEREPSAKSICVLINECIKRM